MEWRSCPPDPLTWFNLREILLGVLFNPALLLPLLVAAVLIAAWLLHTPTLPAAFTALVVALAASMLYTPLATSLLTGWLLHQVPSAPPNASAISSSRQAVVVLVGRGADIATATTRAAAMHWHQGDALAAYVSGDAPSTAQQLRDLGVPADRLAGDSCARTTWENATLTASWLRQHHPGAPVLLITDPWQLARASSAFRLQGLAVTPQSAAPALDPHIRNRLALRETAAILLYGLQARK